MAVGFSLGLGIESRSRSISADRAALLARARFEVSNLSSPPVRVSDCFAGNGVGEAGRLRSCSGS